LFSLCDSLGHFVLSPGGGRELEQLVVLTNLESLSSGLICQGLPQPELLATLNGIAITQMRTLLSANNVKRLK
jgi:hypothetical protein